MSMNDFLGLAGCCAPGASALKPRHRTEVAARFRALGDPIRIAIVNRLAVEEELCVCHLVDELGRSQPTISHHLRVLRQAGLVTARRKGTWAYYRLVPAALASLAAVLGEPTRTS